MANSKRPKRRRLQSRHPTVRTIHVIGGHVTDAPPGMEVPFMGETMTCILCGTEETSDPEVNSNWRVIALDGDQGSRTYYACPAEFPPDDASRAEFTEAYKKFLMAAAQDYQRKEAPDGPS